MDVHGGEQEEEGHGDGQFGEAQLSRFVSFLEAAQRNSSTELKSAITELQEIRDAEEKALERRTSELNEEFRQASSDLKRRFYEESDRLKKALSDSLERAKSEAEANVERELATLASRFSKTIQVKLKAAVAPLSPAPRPPKHSSARRPGEVLSPLEVGMNRTVLCGGESFALRQDSENDVDVANASACRRSLYDGQRGRATKVPSNVARYLRESEGERSRFSSKRTQSTDSPRPNIRHRGSKIREQLQAGHRRYANYRKSVLVKETNERMREVLEQHRLGSAHRTSSSLSPPDTLSRSQSRLRHHEPPAKKVARFCSSLVDDTDGVSDARRMRSFSPLASRPPNGVLSRFASSQRVSTHEHGGNATTPLSRVLTRSARRQHTGSSLLNRVKCASQVHSKSQQSANVGDLSLEDLDISSDECNGSLDDTTNPAALVKPGKSSLVDSVFTETKRRLTEVDEGLLSSSGGSTPSPKSRRARAQPAFRKPYHPLPMGSRSRVLSRTLSSPNFGRLASKSVRRIPAAGGERAFPLKNRYKALTHSRSTTRCGVNAVDSDTNLIPEARGRVREISKSLFGSDSDESDGGIKSRHRSRFKHKAHRSKAAQRSNDGRVSESFLARASSMF